jgi:hypothetical protein
MSQACGSNLPPNSNFYLLHNIPYVYSFPTDNFEDAGTDGKSVLEKDLKEWWNGVELIRVADDRNPGYCEHSNLLWTCTKFVNVRQGE